MQRYGEADNPGPPGQEDGEGRAEAMTTDEAWERARTDPSWVPAWKTWSQQIVTGMEGGRLRIDLRAPRWRREDEEEQEAHEWGEEELESFLQQCEVEAGWRSEVDGEQGERMAREWRDWEAEMTMAGIQCPAVEAEEPCAVTMADLQEVESMEPPARAGRVWEGGSRAEREGKRGKRRRWRPLNTANRDDEPTLEAGDTAVAEQCAAREAGDGQEAEKFAVPPPESQKRTDKVRPRGRRQRGAQSQAFVTELVTFNGSGGPQLLEAMETLGAKRATLAALLVQEHHGRGDSLADLQAGAKARGMKLAPNEATVGKGGGRSAGVGVAAPSHRGWGGVLAPRWDLSPRESPGRLAGAWLQAGPRGGLVALSIYCWPSEGMSARNVALITRALEVAAACGSAWVIGGDFNATPSELVATAGRLLDRAGAVVNAPSQPTCYPAVGAARTLDFFLVDARIASAVSQAEILEEVRGSPHRAVVVRIKGREVGGLVQMIQKPRMFPRQRPVGCPRTPLVPREEGA